MSILQLFLYYLAINLCFIAGFAWSIRKWGEPEAWERSKNTLSDPIAFAILILLLPFIAIKLFIEKK